MTFKELNLIQPLLEAVEKQGFEQPSPIQAQAIPYALEGKDILGCAKTGTGKTAAFALPILQRLYERDESEKYPRQIKALVLAPTRELALQIDETFQTFKPFVNLKSTVIFGGVKQGRQVEALTKGIDILVATPGRLIDLHNQHLLDLSQVEYLVLDEADRMLDMGFVHDIHKIIHFMPARRQTMLFSATLPDSIMDLVNELLTEPVRVMISTGHLTVENIHQSLYYVDKLNKAKMLIKMLEDPRIYNAIVFVRTKRNVDILCKKLVKAGIPSVGIHGNKSQNARVRALNDFKDGKARILVATDIAARGLDIDDLTHVFNFDLPEEAENYVHRIGRTARAGNSGEAITFCSFQEKDLLKDVEKFIKASIPEEENLYFPMEDFSPAKKKGGKKPQRRSDKPQNSRKSAKKTKEKAHDQPRSRSDRSSLSPKKKNSEGGHSAPNHKNRAIRGRNNKRSANTKSNGHN